MTVRVRQVAEQRVLSLTRTVKVGQIDDHIDSSDALLESLATQTGHLLVIYHGEVTDQVANPVEVCLPIAHDAVVTVPEHLAGSVVDRVEPAHREAYLTVTKAGLEYPEILDAYEQVDRWISEHGEVCTASPREVYFGVFHISTMDDEVCDVAFPIGD